MNVNRIALVFAKKPPPMTINENVKLAPSPLSSTQPHSHLVFAQREPIFCGLCQQPSRLLYEVFLQTVKTTGLKKVYENC